MKQLDMVNAIIAYESGEMTSMSDCIEFFAGLVKTGLAWSLQGSYGRTARALIENGYIDENGNVLKTEAQWA